MELRVEHLHLQFFGHNESLHDINLSITEGLTVLYGELGSGKTGLLKCVAGINANFSTGDITLDGAPLKTGKDGDVGMVFDDLALFSRRSLYYNLTYPLRLRKVPKAEWRDILKPHLARWGLEKTLLDNPAYRVSKALQVRVALARAGLVPRRVLLLDNPLGGLIPDDRQQLFWTLSRYIRSYQGIVLYATDNVEEVKSLMAKAAVLSTGYLVAYDAPERLMTTLPCTYVATRLIPYWQALDGVAKGGNVHTALGIWTARYPSVYEDKPVLAGIAPAAFDVAITEDGRYTVVDNVMAQGNAYSVLCNEDNTVVVEGILPLCAKVNVATVGEVPIYDKNTELRIGAVEGE